MSQPIPAVRAEESDRKRASLSSAGSSTPARSSASEKSCRPSDPAADTSTCFTAAVSRHSWRQHFRHTWRGETSTPTSHLQKQDAGGWTGSTALTGGEKSWNAPAGGGCFFSGGELWKSWDFIYTAPCSVLEARPKGFQEDIKKGASWPQQYYRVPYVGTIAVPRLIARTKGWVLLLARMQKQLHSRPRLYRRSWKQQRYNRANLSLSTSGTLSFSGGVNNIRESGGCV